MSFKMDLNASKRKRSVPEWMRSPQKSLNRSTEGRKPQRPSYPPISIKKTKQLPKHQSLVSTDDSIKETEGLENGHLPRNSLSFSEDPPEATSSSKEIDDYVMTVEELTKVAQEIINEERQRRAHSLLSGAMSKNKS